MDVTGLINDGGSSPKGATPPSSSLSDTSGNITNENDSGPLNSSTGADVTAATPRLRKRTKTGCLTCRKRRIKCGEERPICSNCVKSKRHCEGYNQRIVFKSSNGWTLMGGAPSYPIPYHTSTLPGSQPGSTVYFDVRPHYGIPIDEHGRPIPIPPHGEYNGISAQYKLPPFSPLPPEHLTTAQPGQQPYQSFNARYEAQRSFQPQNSSSNQYQLSHRPSPLLDMRDALRGPGFQNSFGLGPGQAEDSSMGIRPSVPHSIKPDGTYGPLHTNVASFGQLGPNHSVEPFPRPGISRNFSGARLSIPGSIYDQPLRSANVHSPLDLNMAAVEYHYDYSNSLGYHDEELDLELSPQEAHDRFEGELSMIHDIYNNNAGEGIARDYKNFLHSGILEHYDAEKVAHPLKNSHTARVFMHFLTATAMSVSIFERKPSHPTAGFFFDNQPRDPSQGLWTYVLPMMALSHQGLLHAMLSLSSLQIAKLQNTSPTPAYKHYAYAIKRIHGCVGNPRKRSLPSTLAATLLLAFYEVMTADHQKWCSHLSGAAQLVSEIDFRRMTAIARAQQMDAAADESILSFDKSGGYENPAILDDELVSKLIGREFTYEPPLENMAGFDPQRYRLFADLYWWYARHDTFQSIIAGNRLFLKYSSWRHCPPRAAVGKPSAIYGTHDHILLIAARIADFAARDRERKLKQMQANGGKWRPPAPDPSHQQYQTPFNAGLNQPTGAPDQPSPPEPSPPQPSPPQFFGMAPMPTNIGMPPSYANNAVPPPSGSCSSSDDTSSDLAYQTEAAIAEWNQMYTALKELEIHFGPSFQPLPSDVHAMTMTPFGEALHYASLDMGCLWALYYAAHIIALRCHPHMSPYVMMAAGFAAPQTADFAQRIGRIAAGMMPGEVKHPISPSLGATLCEVTVPVFVAGIQYRDAAQRDWLVRRMRELEGLAGWASIGMIAQGCETAWIKAAAAGRGPPYVPSKEASAVTTTWERVGPSGTEVLRPPAARDRKGNMYRSNRDHIDDRLTVGDETRSPGTVEEPGLRVQWAMGLLGPHRGAETDK